MDCSILLLGQPVPAASAEGLRSSLEDKYQIFLNSISEGRGSEA